MLHFIYCYAACPYAECRYAECRHEECHCAECRNAECRGAAAPPLKNSLKIIARRFVNNLPIERSTVLCFTRVRS